MAPIEVPEIEGTHSQVFSKYLYRKFQSLFEVLVNLHFSCQTHSILPIRPLLVWSAKRLQCNQQILFHRVY